MSLHFIKLASKLLDDYKESTQYVDDVTQRLIPEAKRNGITYIPEIPSECVVDWAIKNTLPQPCFASTETFDALITEFKLKEKYDEWSKCFYDNIELVSEIFLAQGEEMLSERFTYLEEPFVSYQKGTAAFVRQTNIAEYCLIMQGHFILDSKTRDASSTDLVRIEKPDIEALKDDGITVKKIGRYLADGLLKGAGGKVGVLIFNSIFSSSMSNFIDDVYKTIEKIVNDALTSETIDQLNGVIRGLETWVRNVYTEMKEGGTYDAEMLSKRLEPEEQKLAIDVIGVLMEERYEKPGICVFMIGAGMHLAILQELAYEDYSVEETRPIGSPYLGSVKKYAKDYGDHAKAVVDAILKERLAMITGHSSTVTQNGLHITKMHWVDAYDGSKSKDYAIVYDIFWNECENHQEEYEKDMQKHKDTVRADLLEQMDDPYSTIEQWYELQENPLPPSE